MDEPRLLPAAVDDGVRVEVVLGELEDGELPQGTSSAVPSPSPSPFKKGCAPLSRQRSKCTLAPWEFVPLAPISHQASLP